MVCEATSITALQSARVNGHGISRRAFIEHTLGLGAVAMLPATADTTAHAQHAGTGPASSLVRSRPGTVGGTRLVLLGTGGGPGIDPTRAQTASAVVIGDTPYLVDCGYGALRQLVASKVGYLQLSTLFFTHLHDDHTADLPALLTLQWTNGKTTMTDAYGPFGTDTLVAAAVAFSRANFEIRTADEGRTVDPTKQFHGHDIVASATPVLMFKDDRVTVTAVENTHYPDRAKAKMPHRSLALRFDTTDRCIVFSGDTAYSANVARLPAMPICSCARSSIRTYCSRCVSGHKLLRLPAIRRISSAMSSMRILRPLTSPGWPVKRGSRLSYSITRSLAKRSPSPIRSQLLSGAFGPDSTEK